MSKLKIKHIWDIDGGDFIVRRDEEEIIIQEQITYTRDAISLPLSCLDVLIEALMYVRNNTKEENNE
jgi:hypothetical protein